MLVRQSGSGQDGDIHIDFAEGLVRTCLAHGCAQGADAGINIPPGGIVGQRIEVDQRIFETDLAAATACG